MDAPICRALYAWRAAPFVKAATTLSALGPEGAALVQEWGGPTSHDFQENFAYAREAFRDIAANRPDLIAKVDRSGLGNDPAILITGARQTRTKSGQHDGRLHCAAKYEFIV